MLDIKFVRTNPDAVKENIKKKFQDEKIPMVDEVIEFDAKYRAAKTRCDELRAQRNKKSKEIGGLMAKGQKEEAEKIKAEGLRHLLEYRAPRALPGGRCGARLRVQPEVRQQEQRLAQGVGVRRVNAAVFCSPPDHRLQIQGDGLFQQVVQLDG